jgi:competence protein ComEC
VAVVLATVVAGFMAADQMPAVRATLWFGVAAGACSISLLTKGWGARVALLVAVLTLAGGWFAHRIHGQQDRGLAALLGSDEIITTVEGVVQEDPRRAQPDRRGLGAYSFAQPSWYLDLRCSRIGQQPTSGVLRVWFRGGRPEIDAGDRARISGAARGLDAPLNPGEPDARKWGAQRGLAGSISVPNATLVEPATHPPGVAERAASVWYTLRGAMRARAGAVLDGIGDDRSRALAEAMLLGRHDPALRDTREAFQRLGLAHLLAISGFHLVVMAGAALLAVRATGDRGRLEPVLLALLVLAYLVLVPARPPIVRAGFMLLALLAVESTGRRYDRVAVLGWIAVAMLIHRPMDAFALGFQLSVGITAALIWIARTVHERIFPSPVIGTAWRRPRGVRHAIVGQVKMLVVASLIGWGVAAPVVAWRIGIVSPLAVLATLIVLPLVVVMLWIGFGALMIGVVVPPLGALASGAIGSLGGVVIAIVDLLDTVPGSSLRVAPTSAFTAAIGVAAVVWWLVRGHARCRVAWALTGVFALVFGYDRLSSQRLGLGVALRIDTIAVGDGACHLIRSGGDAVLWDCGSMSGSAATRTIPRTLRALGVHDIDSVVLSHANVDHFNGVLEVERLFEVEQVLIGRSFDARGAERPGGAAAFALDEFARRGVDIGRIGAGDSIAVGGASIEIIAPTADFEAENDRSLVAVIDVPTQAGTRRILMTGDIQADAMRAISAAGALGGVHVIELPHHGSAHADAIAFFDEIDPSVVLQSTGPSRVGDPRWASRRRGRVWYTTASDGAAWVRIGRDGELSHGSFRERATSSGR